MTGCAPSPIKVSPGMYGRQEAFRVHRGLQEKGPVKVPREFVFMDRAAIGLGGVFLHLNAELNYHRLFDDTIAGRRYRARQRAAPASVRCSSVPRAGMCLCPVEGGRWSSREPGAGRRLLPRAPFLVIPAGREQ